MDDGEDRQTVSDQLQEQQRAWQVWWADIYMRCPNGGMGSLLAIQPSSLSSAWQTQETGDSRAGDP